MVSDSLDQAERRLSLGHRLMMLGHLKDKFRRNRVQLDRYRTQMMDQSLGQHEPEADPLGLGEVDDMLVLGNVTVTSTTQSEKPDALPLSAAPTTSTPPTMLSKALPYVLTALATAAGLGGVGWTAGLFDKEPAIQQPIEHPTPPGYGLSL